MFSRGIRGLAARQAAAVGRVRAFHRGSGLWQQQESSQKPDKLPQHNYESSQQLDQLPQQNYEDSLTHYIDTMSIYNELVKAGFTGRQSDVILRLINENLTQKLNKLNSKVLAKNDLENEVYLFEAAQSEMRFEVKHARELALKILENEKNQLDYQMKEESDELNKLMILSKNESQVMMNDQFSENTLLQKSLKKSIQNLNNKISTNINSDIKSDIESLRWQTTRSGLLAVLILVFLVMSGVSITARLNREEKLTEVVLHTISPEDSSTEEDDVENEADEAIKLK